MGGDRLSVECSLVEVAKCWADGLSVDVDGLYVDADGLSMSWWNLLV